MRHRKPKIPDFPIMINKLTSDGMSIKKLADSIECHVATLSHTKNESRDIPPGWLQSYYLIDLYIRKFGIPIPFYGEHNE